MALVVFGGDVGDWKGVIIVGVGATVGRAGGVDLGQTPGCASLLVGEAEDFHRGGRLLLEPLGLLDAEPKRLGISAAAATGARLR